MNSYAPGMKVRFVVMAERNGALVLTASLRGPFQSDGRPWHVTMIDMVLEQNTTGLSLHGDVYCCDTAAPSEPGMYTLEFDGAPGVSFVVETPETVATMRPDMILPPEPTSYSNDVDGFDPAAGFAAQVEYMRHLIDNGVMSPNDARAALGLEPTPELWAYDMDVPHHYGNPFPFDGDRSTACGLERACGLTNAWSSVTCEACKKMMPGLTATLDADATEAAMAAIESNECPKCGAPLPCEYHR